MTNNMNAMILLFQMDEIEKNSTTIPHLCICCVDINVIRQLLLSIQMYVLPCKLAKCTHKI